MLYSQGLKSLMNELEKIIFWYPYLMSIIWVVGGIIFAYYREKGKNIDITKYEWPLISILLPCFNEESTVEETIENLSKLSYPKFEILAINDGSSDKTGEILKRLSEKYEVLRVIDCHENKGKANALHIAAHVSKGEFLLCVDSDAILDDMAPYYLIRQFIEHGERVGAVTGNPRIRNRDTLLSRLQLVEYASIIGLIKRTQRILGKVMTVSGVIVAYRKKALVSVNLWDRDIITEDIAVSWKLQKKFWDIRYEPNALCWMLVPETIKGLWKQRVRWAQGGQEIIFRHIDIFKDWRERRLWPIYVEQVFSTFWSFALVIVTIYLLFIERRGEFFLMCFTFTAFALAFISFIQLFISVKLESSYDNIMKYYIWAAWYPLFYWIINVLVVIRAFPKAIRSSFKGGYATWKSPDRGDIKKEKSKNLINNFIVKSKNGLIGRIVALILNIVMWFYMFVVIDMFFSTCFNYEDIISSFFKRYMRIDNDGIRSFMFFTLEYSFGVFLVMILWKIYNMKRFGKLKRRKYPENTTRGDILELELMKPEIYDNIYDKKVIIFEKNPIRDLLVKK